MAPINTRYPLTAVRAYTSLGWPLVIGHRIRPRQGCTCEAADCPTPGAHPLPGRLVCPPKDVLAREIEHTPGASLIAPTAHFDAVLVPQQVGLTVILRLEGCAPVPCVISRPYSVLLVQPGTGGHALTASEGAGELRTGPDQWIALPPSHGTRWDTHPWDDLSLEALPLLHGGDLRQTLTQAFSLFGASPEEALR